MSARLASALDPFGREAYEQALGIPSGSMLDALPYADWSEAQQLDALAYQSNQADFAAFEEAGGQTKPRQWDTTFNPYLGTLYNPDIRTDAKLNNPLFQAYASANGLDPTAGGSLVQFKSYLNNEFGINARNADTKAVMLWGDQIPREMFIDQVVGEFGTDFIETINNSVDMQVALADRIAGHGPGDLIDVSDFWQFSVKQSLDKAAQHPGGWLWNDVYKNPGSIYDGSVPLASSALASYNLKSILSDDYGAAPKLREYNSRGLALDLAVEFAALATPFKASHAGFPSLAEGAVGFRLAENASARIAQTGRLLDNLEASSLANASSNLSLHAKVERLIQSRGGPSKANPSIVKQESGGTLIYHENFGGHPVSKHVGRTDRQLIDRFVTEPHIPSSSSFTNLEIADKAVGDVLVGNRGNIQSWLAGTDRQLPLSMNLGYDVGRKVLNGSTTVQTSTDAFVLLRRDPLMPNGYRVHTAYPE